MGFMASAQAAGALQKGSETVLYRRRCFRTERMADNRVLCGVWSIRNRAKFIGRNLGWAQELIWPFRLNWEPRENGFYVLGTEAVAYGDHLYRWWARNVMEALIDCDDSIDREFIARGKV